MTSIYNAIAWFFDISFYQAIDVYDEMKSLGEDRQIEQIRRDYIKALLDTTGSYAEDQLNMIETIGGNNG